MPARARAKTGTSGMVSLEDVASFIAKHGRLRVDLPIEQQVSNLSLRPPSDLKPLITQVESHQHAAAFIFLMEQHLRHYPHQWRNPYLADFLQGLAVAASRYSPSDQNETFPALLTWQVFVDLLWRAGVEVSPPPFTEVGVELTDIWGLVEACDDAVGLVRVLHAIVQDLMQRKEYWAAHYNDTLESYLASLWGLLIEETEYSQPYLEWRLAARLLINATFYE